MINLRTSVGPAPRVTPASSDRSPDANTEQDTLQYPLRNHYQEMTDTFHRIRLALSRLSQDPSSDRRAIESFQREVDALQQNLPERGNHPAVMIHAENVRALAGRIMTLLPKNDPSVA